MLILNVCLVWCLHPVHISVTEIEYSEKNKSLQITSRIFIDDLELAIRGKTGLESLDILHPGTGATTDQLVRDYLRHHLKIELDGKAAKMNYLTHETEDVAIICYLEIEGVKRVKAMKITNDVIQEIHGDQSNLVHVTYKAPVKSFRLTREQPTNTFRFD